ncbi:MAG: hypothetical protein IT439_12200 [Phycisphaerales bacterium]|nr:hypothetical protein [Phycisphaerales bacterium]
MPLTLGDARVHLSIQGTTEELGRARAAAEHAPAREPAAEPFVEIDLGLVEERCRLKASSCRLLIERRGARGGSEAERAAVERLNTMIARAKTLPNCFLWVFWQQEVQPADDDLLVIAECYDALADAVSLVRRIDAPGGEGHPGDMPLAFAWLAEASSALRVALADTWLARDDQDQYETHQWLRRETAGRRVYIQRHMTLDDPAQPAGATDLRAKIRELLDLLSRRADVSKQVHNTIGQVRYHAGLIAKNGVEHASEHWPRIESALERLASWGVGPTDPRVKEALNRLAAAARPAGSHPAGLLAAALGAIEGAVAGVADTAPDEPESTGRAWSTEVLTVRAWLRGKRMVVIGGERNLPAIARLEEAFALREVEWVSLTEHGSGAPMRAPIQRPETALVIVIIKLTGHLHADEARAYAADSGKPCVVLPGGYNPERVAVEISSQASERLQSR